MVDVPDEQVQQAYQSGQFGFTKGARVPVALSSGDVGTVDAKDFLPTLESGGRLASQQELHHAQVEEKYGGFTGGLMAAGEGVARGLTFGLSDPLAVALGGEGTRQHLADVKEAHSVLATGGEIAGAVAPLLLSGGTSAAATGASLARGGAEAVNLAKGASALGRAGEAASAGIRGIGVLPRLTAEAGAGAERLAARLVGEGATSVGGRIAQTAIKKAAGAAAEGAIFSAGQEVSEATLGNHELTAEKLLAGIGHGALMGGIIGGGLGGLGRAGSEATSAIAAKMKPKLSELAGENAWKALSPLKKFTTEAEKRAGGSASVGRTLIEEGVIPTEEGALKVGLKHATPEDLLPRITEAKGRVGEAIGQIAKQSKATVEAGELIASYEKLVQPLRRKAGFEGIVSTLDEYQGSLLKKLGVMGEDGLVASGPGVSKIPIADVIEQRRALGDLAYREAKALDPKLRVQYLRDFYGELSGLEHKAIDEAATKFGGPGAAELKTLNKKFQHLSIAEEAAQDTQTRMATNRNFSLSDYLSAGAAAASGHGLLAPVAAVAHKIARERGNAVAAVILDKVSQLGAIQRVTNKVDTQVEGAVSGYFKSLKDKRLSARTFKVKDEEFETPRARYEERAKQVAVASSLPKVEAEHVARVLGPSIGTHAPNTMGAMAKTAQAGTAYLAAHLPKTAKANPLTPQLERPKVSDAEMTRFLKVAAVVDNPTSILQDLHNGTVTRDQVDAMKKVYPQMYEEMRTKVMVRLTDQKADIPYSAKVQLGLLLDLPSDPSLSAQSVKQYQSTFNKNPKQGAGQSPSAGHPPARPLSDPTKDTTMQLQGR